MNDYIDKAQREKIEYDLDHLDPGDSLTFNVDGHHFIAVILGGGALHTGSLVVCETCRELLTEATTSAVAYVEQHLAHRSDNPREFEKPRSSGPGSPIPMRLHCPMCHALHVDVEFATKTHHTHACQSCGEVWRPAIVPTVGVRFLPGFKDEESK